MTGVQDVAAGIAGLVTDRGLTVAAAESVTAGHLAAALASAPEASDWFAGSIVAYRTQTKRRVLGVTATSLISEECAHQLAEGVWRLVGADVVVATTGVGGPDPEEGQPAGTVIVCAGTRDRLQCTRYALEGDPEQIVHEATLRALEQLAEAVREC